MAVISIKCHDRKKKTDATNKAGKGHSNERASR